MWASYESPHIIITLYAFFKTIFLRSFATLRMDSPKALYLKYLKPIRLTLELYCIAKGGGGDPVT